MKHTARLFLALMISTAAGAESWPVVEYPAGYRNWTHVKSAVIGPANPAHERFGGMHHIYANAKALTGLKSGTFEAGSILIFDRLDVTVQQDVTSESSRKALDVMEKDKKRFAATGGWGFEEFRGDSHTERNVGGDTVKQCFSCHSKTEKTGFVFTKWRE